MLGCCLFSHMSRMGLMFTDYPAVSVYMGYLRPSNARFLAWFGIMKLHIIIHFCFNDVMVLEVACSHFYQYHFWITHWHVMTVCLGNVVGFYIWVNMLGRFARGNWSMRLD